MSRRNRSLVAVFLIIGTAMGGPVMAALNGMLTVRWDPNTTDPDLAQYKVYLSTDASIFALTPAQAAALATTRVVDRTVTESIFTSLDPARVYWVAVTSIDTSSNESGFSMVVSAQPRDTTPPTVAITAPTAGTSVSGLRTVSATATDDVAVAGVQFKVDGADIGAEDTTSPYAISWTTTGVANGSHTLTAVARDAGGNTTTSAPISVTVNNPDITPPSVAVTAPAGGASVLGTVSVTGTATDNVGVVGVQFKLDGVALGVEDTTSPYSTSWNTTGTTNGPHTLTATARDAVGNSATSAGVSVNVNNPDITPPTVSMTAPASGATIIGTVSVTATASDNVGVVGVQFRIDGAALGAEDTSSPWSVSWTSTTAVNGTHALTAVARDAAGNTKTSTGISVTVNNPDTTVPTVSVTAPAGGASVQGTVSVTATASDNIGVVGVQFRLDGVVLGAEDTTSPYAASWSTTATSNGAHTLTAVARDAAGNTATSAGVSVTVNNPDTTPPAVSVTAPASGATVVGTVTVTGNATDNVGVVGVQFRLDGNPLGAEDTSSPWSVSWDSTAAANGPHTLTAVARDAAGNTTTSAAISVTVNNPDVTPPTVSITAPLDGAVVLLSVSVTASATDNRGVTGVQFKLDGANLGAEDTSAPYAIIWDTLTIPNGAHTLTAVARDAAGNTTTAVTVTVTVNNDRTPPSPPSNVRLIP